MLIAVKNLNYLSGKKSNRHEIWFIYGSPQTPYTIMIIDAML